MAHYVEAAARAVRRARRQLRPVRRVTDGRACEPGPRSARLAGLAVVGRSSARRLAGPDRGAGLGRAEPQAAARAGQAAAAAARPAHRPAGPRRRAVRRGPGRAAAGDHRRDRASISVDDGRARRAGQRGRRRPAGPRDLPERRAGRPDRHHARQQLARRRADPLARDRGHRPVRHRAHRRPAGRRRPAAPGRRGGQPQPGAHGGQQAAADQAAAAVTDAISRQRELLASTDARVVELAEQERSSGAEAERARQRRPGRAGSGPRRRQRRRRPRARGRRRPASQTLPDVPAPNAVAAAAIAAAATRLGMPYVWGATGPNTFDCSGLMQWAYAQAGVPLPRTSRAQYAALPHVPLTELAPGDLVFYATTSATRRPSTTSACTSATACRCTRRRPAAWSRSVRSATADHRSGPTRRSDADSPPLTSSRAGAQAHPYHEHGSGHRAAPRSAPRRAGRSTLDRVGPGSVLGGRYVLKRRLDDASETSTWQAHDETLERPVHLRAIAADHPRRRGRAGRRPARRRGRGRPAGAHPGRRAWTTTSPTWSASGCARRPWRSSSPTVRWRRRRRRAPSSARPRSPWRPRGTAGCTTCG